MAFLSTAELLDAYDVATTQARKYFEPFDEYERLSANKIRPDLPHQYPKVNDGTLAALLPENAKRVFQKLHTGHFTSLDRDETWLIELINILWNRVIVPGAQTDADFYTKFWNLYYRSQQHGAAAAFAYFTTKDNYTGADFSVDYIRDILPEPGKVSHQASNYNWRNSYHTKLDLQNIIEYCTKEEARAKKGKRDSYANWDVPLLKAFVNAGPDGKAQQDKNLTEREKQLAASHFKLATCFHRGSDAPFYTIIPSMQGKLARTRKNENPTGDTPITLMYYTQDLQNPYGKGMVEMAGSNQNVMDYFTQADVLATQKGMDPPLKIKGAADSATGLVLSSLVNAPSAKWRVGNADVEVVNETSSVYTFLQNRMGMYKGNLMNLLGQFDTSVGAAAGNPSFSKTDAGVNTLNARGTVNDNFFASAGAQAFRQLAKTMMNIHMANMQGNEVFTLLEDEVQRLQKGGWELMGSTKALLEYDNLRGKFDFEVDDPRQIDDPETQGLLDGIKLLTENATAIPTIEAAGTVKVDLGEMYQQYFAKLQLSNLDKIFVPIDTQDATDNQTPTVGPDGQPLPQPQEDQAQPSASDMQMQPKPPTVSIAFKDLPPAGKIQAAADYGIQLTPQDVSIGQPLQAAPTPDQQVSSQSATEDPIALQQELEQTMQQYGIDQEQAMLVMGARRHGESEEDIASYLAQQGASNG